MTTYRTTHIPPRPNHWPFAAATLTALLIFWGAVLLSAPALLIVLWLPAMWFTGQLIRCWAWGSAYGEEVSQ